ncbi:MAG TPA: DUF4124 domain-containing protein [Pseudomonadales bacterium]|nr:DUF4124 domain-containing protein [Pseudomonadales bacterium]
MRHVPAALCILVLPLLAAAAEPIYKTRGADGTPVFTDRPGAAPAEAVTLPAPNTMAPVEVPPRGRSDDARESTPGPAYEVAILSPGESETLRSNNGDLTVVGSVDPELGEDDRLQLLLDGRTVATSRDGSFQLTALDRGEHRIQVRVIDGEGRVHAASPVRTLYLLRRSTLN